MIYRLKKKRRKVRVRTGIWGPASRSHARSLLPTKRKKKFKKNEINKYKK